MPWFKFKQECDNCGYWTISKKCRKCGQVFPKEEYKDAERENAGEPVIHNPYQD